MKINKHLVQVLLAIVLAYILARNIEFMHLNNLKELDIKEYITSKSCSSCYQINKEVISTHPDIKIFYIDESKDATIERFGTTLVKVPQMILSNGNILEGKDEINQFILDKSTKGTKVDTTIYGVIMASAVDSINICAIGCMLFLIVFLQGRKKNIVFTLFLFVGTVFVTYSIIGITLMTVTNILFKAPNAFRIIGVLLSLFLIYSIYKCSEKLDKQPEFRCEGGVCKIDFDEDEKSKTQKLFEKLLLSNGSVILAAIFVSISEFACSGMIYIPTLMLVSESLKRYTYLIIYNAIFILPLVIVGIFYKKISGIIEKYKGNTTVIKFMIIILVIMLGLTIKYYLM